MLITVGHGTLEAEEFLRLLDGAALAELRDGRLTVHQPSPETRLAAADGGPTLVHDVGADRPLFADGADS